MRWWDELGMEWSGGERQKMRWWEGGDEMGMG